MSGPLKKKLRTELCLQRKNLDPTLASQYSQIISETLIAHPYFIQSYNIGLYAANSQLREMDPALILQYALDQNKACYLPIIQADQPTLLFAKTTKDSQYIKNKYQINEPISTVFIDPYQLDLVLVPILGFNQQRSRLGMGGGYYDQTFRSIHENNHKNRHKPILIGLAFSLQCREAIPHEPHDVHLDLIITERETYE